MSDTKTENPAVVDAHYARLWKAGKAALVTLERYDSDAGKPVAPAVDGRFVRLVDVERAFSIYPFRG